MEASMFTGLFGAMSMAKKLDVVANNLANVNTGGFKRSEVTFEDTMLHFAYDEVKEPVHYIKEPGLFPEGKNMSRVRIVGEFLQLDQGSLMQTNNPLDVAIQGEGFFKIQHPTGIAYTRSGSFVKGEDGRLMTKQGFAVMGKSGVINIPSTARSILIDEEGRIMVDGEELAQLDIVSVAPSGLKQAGDSLFFAENAQEGASNAVIAQGHLENSNVNAVKEMVSLIEVNRLFEMYQKVMQTSDTIATITSRIAKPV